MSNYNDTLSRMKELYTYGKELNESKDMNTHSIEYHAIAADGKSYGIIRENSKYYIKSAPKAKELMAEAYDYIGGFCNKKNYEYTSYNNALKNFELKMASINEAFDGKVNISTLDPFKKDEYLVEATDAMKNEIARQRQIMHNAAMLMNESSEIGADRKNDVVMYDGKNPEAPTGKEGDEYLKDTKAEPEFEGKDTNGVDKKAVPFEETPKAVNEACDAAGCDSEKEDWGSVGLNKGEDPEKVGWDMEGQQPVNEENNEWGSEGLPETPGVGEADTDHNNDPFKETVNEEEELDAELESEPEEGEFDDVDVEDIEDDDTFDVEDDAEDTEEVDLGDEETEELPTEEPAEEPEAEEIADLQAKIEDLEKQLEDLKAQVNNEEEVEDAVEAEEPVDDVEVELPTEEPAEEPEAEEELPAEDDEFENVVAELTESVMRRLLKEDELHVFGKHPGYQKKPMELPTTGEDKNQWGEDINDESAHTEEPFGEKIGDGDPFNKVVDSVTKSVIAKLMEGKKKVK